MKISDFKGLLKKSEVIVESVSNPFDDYYVVMMNVAEGMSWRPGEHGVFTLPDFKIDGKKWRAFSIASIPEEKFLIIGTRSGENISEFKKQLIALKKGDKIGLRGPFGWFVLKDRKSPLVLIAGGVGITPIRGILKELEKENIRQVEIIYSSREGYLFEDELKQIAEKDERVNLNLTRSREETQDKIGEIAKRFKNDAYYYVSGNPKMIKGTKKQILGEGVKGGRIINDPFYGAK